MTKKFSSLVRAMLSIAFVAPALNAACGGGVANDDAVADAGLDLDAEGTDSGSPLKDGGSAIVDAGPDAICPGHWEVYGATDPSDDLGHVDPRLIASGECHGVSEEFSDAGFAPSDFTMTLTQSAPGSGMFVTQVAQTTPFVLSRTVCLQSSGPNTGAAGYPDDGGQMCLTDVTEDQIPWDPNLVTFTNLEDSDSGLFVSLNQSTEAGVTVNNGWCRFVKN
jgi:hypothetical protein